MMSVINPRVCTSSALSHTIALAVMCGLLAPILQLTTWNFAIDSLPFNLYFIYLAIQFKRNGDAKSSRNLFRYSLLYLPMIILLMLITKYPVEKQPPHQPKPRRELYDIIFDDIRKFKRPLKDVNSLNNNQT